MKKTVQQLRDEPRQLTQIELRVDEPWQNADTWLLALAGTILLVLTGVFFSARRLDSRTALTQESTYRVGAAGVELRERDLYGPWTDGEIHFNFHEGGTVDIADDLSGELVLGGWSFAPSSRSVTITLAGTTGPERVLRFSAEPDLLILIEQQNSDFALGSAFGRER